MTPRETFKNALVQMPANWANMGHECKRLEDAGVERIRFDMMERLEL